MACLLKVSVFLHLSLIFLGIIKIGWEEYIKHELRLTKNKLQLLEDDGMLVLLQIISLHNLVIHIIGIYQAKRILVAPFNNAFGFVSKCWLFFAMESLVFDILKLVLSLHLSQTLMQEAEGVLMSGIKMYTIDIYWNIFWNHIQFSNSCCGVLFYKDWRNIRWSNLNQEHVYIQLARSNKTIVPSSCCQSQISCNIAIIKTYYEDSFVDVSDLKSVNVFQNGCLVSFIGNVVNKLEIGIIIIISSVAIQLIILIFHRTLFLKNRGYL